MSLAEIFFAASFYFFIGFFWMSMWYIDAIGEKHGTVKNMFLQISMWPLIFVTGLIFIIFNLHKSK